MKDYYYILGIKKEASTDEIKKAYRKLSLKFHPDKNDGDDFFTERFKEIQEAYETLSDIHKRTKYDSNFSNQRHTGNTTNGYNFDPIIEYFRVNKSSFVFEEEITFSWKTINSNKVMIKPFGIVQPIGEKIYKLKDFKNAVLNFELIAENTNINRQVKQSLKLNNKTFHELYSYFKKIIESESIFNKKTTAEDNTKNFNEQKQNVLIQYETNKGTIVVSQKYSTDSPNIGNEVFQNGKLISNGKFKMGFMWYLYIENGKIVKIGLT